jgi:hypothetical protein
MSGQGWQPIADLADDAYVLGFYPREDGCIERCYFLGRRYDIRENALINEWTGRWRVVSHWMPLPEAPVA